MMTKAKTTKTEAGRLQALYRYDILDTSEDPNFNDLVALAAATCKMPMAAINFVESERTWTKAKVGLNLVEQHRRFSICAQTILQNDTMVIADLQADERFSKYDLVTGESKLRFYAGAPLVNSDGYAIGTLCVMSNEPSAMSAEQQVSLRAIARQVVTQLELRHRLAREVHVKRDLDLNNELEFSTVFENLPHGIAKLNSEAKFIQANSAFLRLLGYSKEELCGMTEYDLTHAQDLNPLSDVARCFRDAHFRNSKIQKRYVAKDGSIVWTQVSGIRVDGDDENDDCVLLAIEDIGTIKALEAESQSMVDSLEQARRLASEKSQQLEDLFENMNEGVLLQDESARIVQLNRAAMEILGLNAEEMAGRFALDPHWNARRSDGQPLAADEHPIAVALKTGKPQLQYPIIVKKKEANAHLTINAVPLFRKGQEKPHGVLCTFSDLTQLQATKIELENTLNVIPAGLYRTDVNGKCTYVNRNWCELSGMSSEESVQSGWMGNIHPDDQERVTVEWTATLTGGHQFETVYRLLRSDGTIAHVQASASTVSDVGGVPGGYLRSIQDITSLREAEILNAFYKTSLDTAAIVAFTDGKGRITYANNMFCEISGHSREELIGSRHRMIDSGLSGKFPTKEMWESSEGPKKWHGEICGRAKNGSEYWVATTVVPVIGVDGKAERFMSLGRDVTQQKRQQQELAEAYRKAELATNAKSDFLSTMSHEIRTPLNGVIGMTSLLQESKLTAEQAEYVDAISSSGTILLSIINDILDFSKIEAGKVDIEQTEFDLESYIKELIRPLQYPAQKKGIILNYESSNYSHRVLGDDGKIGQIVTNLVSNAIKFTSTGSVLVRTRLEAVDQKTVISLEVMDTGIGIPEEAMDRMFQPFSQAEKSTTRKFGGTGLGLSISKRLVDLMGGKIHLTSEFGKGTTFSVQLQLETGRQIEKQVVDEIQKLALASNSRKRPTLLGRVLVAEDNTTNQKVIARMLEKWGCKYHIVANGNEVLDVMRDTRFDLILMDCQMPEMDGYTATRLIRQSNPLAQNTPIVALTANAISGDETLCVQAGMNGYLTKPVDMRDLEAVLVKYLKIDTRDQVASEV